jgi:glycosyltransferase involved in cell wall biosynthesis
MRVALINTMDVKGGAARAAYRLHKALRGTGIDSTYYVRDQQQKDPTIQRFVPDPSPQATQRRMLASNALISAYNAYAATRSPDIELFSQERAGGDENFLVQLPRSELINLHWVAGFLDFRLFFSPRMKKPIVWTLHDMNPFTGGCHYDQTCGKFRDRCGACPLLGSRDEEDLSRKVFQGKEAALKDWPAPMLHIATPSRWLAQQARESTLFGRFEASVIPNSIEIDIFKPSEKAAARARLTLPQDATIVIFVSNHIRLARKGFRELVEALSRVPNAGDLVLLGVGDSHILSAKAPFRVIQADHVYDDATMALLYAAADVTAIPSRQDNLPNTILESFACGTPVVGFAEGGIPDAVREGETGFLGRSGSVADLAFAFTTAFSDRDRLRACGVRARRVAETEYAPAVQAAAYAELYRSRIEAVTRAGLT